MSLGGMVAAEVERRRLCDAELEAVPHLRRSFSKAPFDIHVPSLTRRERLYLDAHMPPKKGWKPRAFELSEHDLESYGLIYRFTPVFAELIS